MQLIKGDPGKFWCASHRARRPTEPTHKPGEYLLMPCAICEREAKAARIQHWRNTVDDQPLGPRIFWSNPPFTEPRRTFNPRFLPKVWYDGDPIPPPTKADLAVMRAWRDA